MIRATCAAIAGSWLLTACVPVPVTGSIDKLELPPVVAPAVPGEGLGIVGGGDMDDLETLPTCVRNAVAKADPGLRMIAPQELRDALFPWLERSTYPRTADTVAGRLGQPAVKAKIAELDLRFVAVITGSTTEGPQDSFGAASWGGLGSTWWTQTSRLSAWIIDLKHAASPGSIVLSVSATGSLTAVSLLTVVTIPVTETPACQELGNQLAAYLTGRPPKASDAEAGERGAPAAP